MFHKEKPDDNRSQYGFYTLDQFIPEEHFLRKIEAVIDFAFISKIKDIKKDKPTKAGLSSV